MAEQRRGWLKTGCIGCVALVGVAVLIVAVTAVLGWLSMKPVQIETLDSKQDVPPVEVVPASNRPGRIMLDVAYGEFALIPGPAGSGIRLNGQYDAGAVRIEESYEPDEGEGWTYELRVAATGWFGFGANRSDANRLRLTVPRDLPLEIEGSVTSGNFRFELGGLALSALQIDHGVGLTRFNFDEPLPVPMEVFRVRGKLGEVFITNLGNASPRLVDAGHGFGGIRLDLGGLWLRDTTIDLVCTIGDCRVTTSDTVALEIERIHITAGDQTVPVAAPRSPEIALPTARLSVDVTLGEVRIE